MNPDLKYCKECKYSSYLIKDMCTLDMPIDMPIDSADKLLRSVYHTITFKRLMLCRLKSYKVEVKGCKENLL